MQLCTSEARSVEFANNSEYHQTNLYEKRSFLTEKNYVSRKEGKSLGQL